MASDGDPANLWDANHEDGKELTSLHGTYHQLLMGNFMTLIGKLQFSQCFWTHLLKLGVVDNIVKGKIQGAKTRETQLLKLVDHVINSEIYKFHGFAWAIVNSQQYELARDLGFDLKVYLDESHFIKTSSFICPACCDYNTKAYILPECGHYVCSPCVKGAQFTCKDNKKEDITCPVPECGNKSESHPNSESAIGLKEDVSYAKACKLIQGQVQEGKEFKDTDSQKHIACKETEKKTNPNWNDVLNAALKKKVSEITSYEQKFRRYEDTIVGSNQRLRNHVEETKKRIITWVENWHAEQEEFICHAKVQVQTKHAEGIHWQKVMRDLIIMSNVYPSRLEKIASELADTGLPKLDGAPPAVVSFVEQQISGTSIPKMILIPRQLDTHSIAELPMTIDRASFILEWRSTEAEILDLDWTIEGNIDLCTDDQTLTRLALDLGSKSFGEMNTFTDVYGTSICTTKDGTIYVGDNESEVVMVYDPIIMEWENWQTSEQEYFVVHLSVSQNAKHLVVSYDGKTHFFDERRKRKHKIDMPFVKKTCICKDTLVVAAQGVRLINLETMKRIHLPAGKMSDLESPFDVAPFGEDHFLVHDKELEVFKVFSLTGKFIHTLAIDGKRHKTPQSDCKEHVSIATFPKEGTPTHLAVAYCSVLRVYSLT